MITAIIIELMVSDLIDFFFRGFDAKSLTLTTNATNGN